MRCVFPRRKRGEVEKSVPSLLQLIESFPSFLSPAAASFHSLPSLLFIYLFIYFFLGGRRCRACLLCLSCPFTYLMFFGKGRRRKKKIHISVIYMTHESYGLAHIATRSIPDSIRHNDVQQQKRKKKQTKHTLLILDHLCYLFLLHSFFFFFHFLFLVDVALLGFI